MMNVYYLLLMLFLTFFIPSSSVIGGFQLWYVLLVAMLVIGILLKGKLKYDNKIVYVNIFFVVNFVLLICSFFSSSLVGYLTIRDLNEVLRVVGSFVAFYFFYLYYEESMANKLVTFFKFFIIAQLIFCALQNNSAFVTYTGYIWKTEKIWFYRRVGTFGNPNILSLFALAAYTFVYFRVKNLQKILYGLLTFGIILYTSSKTGLLVFLILISALYLFSRKKINVAAIIKFVAILITGLSVVLFLLFKFQESFPYMAQLLSFIESEGEDVGAIKSINDRQVLWDRALTEYERVSIVQKTFGIGPAKDTIFNMVDNEFLTILLKMGWLTLLAYVIAILALVIHLVRDLKFLYSKEMLSILLIFLLSSISASTFIAWHLSILFYIFLGIYMKMLNHKTNFDDV